MDNDQRQIAVMMVFAVVFALVGKATKGAKDQIGGDAKIILGGTLAIVLLELLAEAAPVASSFAKGLAGITLLSSVLINGEPVFNAINKSTKIALPSKQPTIATATPH